jgi:hypothetical protein
MILPDSDKFIEFFVPYPFGMQPSVEENIGASSS